ncbi:esterase [Frigoribacterium sp. CFBP 8766]|uniref:alpha/beta hydrolase n=1 Tax=Frigoribacterium sp. CFBP 8766 TaxID=2775273 RepID=UPI001782B70F|nr:alpha/beta hydrolase-fold protein [Frigoribacterium sp. CFBP 8766]MBD8583194.1 esterase [Frigoribacterium sp. CFBP 8766]
MTDLLANVPLTSSWLLAGVWAVAAVLLVLVARPPRPARGSAETAGTAGTAASAGTAGEGDRRTTRRRWWRRLTVAALVGAVAGALTTWVAGVVLDVAGVPPTPVDAAWITASSAAVAVAVVALWRTSALRRVTAVLGVVVFLLAGALAVNRDAGAYPTLAAALGVDTAPALGAVPGAGASASSSTTFDPTLWSTWKAPADMPTKGRWGTVHIPGAQSGFPARDAIVYLPPAALVADAPALPVVVMMSGQPANPEAVVTAGHLVSTLDAFAAANHGLAPIAVVPDQLSADDHNPMCVDGALGDSATYVTTDVVQYVSSHYHVASGPRAWTVGGFSQGGTCSIQFGAARPDLFGSIVDVSGELGPSVGSPEETIDAGFAGDRAAYDAAQPQAIMTAHGRYDDTAAFFAVGADDPTFAAFEQSNSAAAAAAGMTVTRYTSPGSGHDWTTATNGFAVGIGDLYPRMGLAATAQVPQLG